MTQDISVTNYNEYTLLCQTTAAKTEIPKNWKTHLSVWALGLVGESVEMLEPYCDGNIPDMKDIVEELGDVMWYLAMLCQEFNDLDLDFVALQLATEDRDEEAEINPSTLWTEYYTMHLVKSCGKLSECIKKIVAQGHPPNTEKLQDLVACVLFNADAIADRCSMTLLEVCKGNIIKLKGRYPDGYDAKKSINR